jgi:hypothetical protein
MNVPGPYLSQLNVPFTTRSHLSPPPGLPTAIFVNMFHHTCCIYTHTFKPHKQYQPKTIVQLPFYVTPNTADISLVMSTCKLSLKV